MNIKLFYDKECPFCKFYANYIKLKENHKLSLLNARESKDKLEILKSKGFDINDGFIIIIDEDKILQGSEAIVFLNDLSNKRIYFPNNYFFRVIIYTLVKFIRKIVLKLLGKKVSI